PLIIETRALPSGPGLASSGVTLGKPISGIASRTATRPKKVSKWREKMVHERTITSPSRNSTGWRKSRIRRVLPKFTELNNRQGVRLVCGIFREKSNGNLVSSIAMNLTYIYLQSDISARVLLEVRTSL